MKHAATSDVHIRWMIRRDMPEVMRIETTVFDFPATEEEIVTLLRTRNCIGQVAEIAEQVIGYMIYTLQPGSLLIDNIAVASAFQRRGVGRSLVNKLIGKLSCERRTRIYARVWEQNLDAQLFFKALGFRAFRVVDDGFEQIKATAYDFEYAHRSATHSTRSGVAAE